jgi:hypothetical protein
MMDTNAMGTIKLHFERCYEQASRIASYARSYELGLDA